MAIEDALVLATLLAEYWDKPDGHIEAFYLYEVSQVHIIVAVVVGRSVLRTTVGGRFLCVLLPKTNVLDRASV